MNAGALRVVEVEARAYRRTWRGSVFSSLLAPLLYLLAMGVGLGTLVDRGPQTDALAGLDYVAFLAPALLTASSMQTAASEATWPVMAGIKWRGTYAAALSTPVRVGELVAGLAMWNTVRVLMTAMAFGIVGVLLGAIDAGRLPALVGVALLVGAATSAPLLAYTASVKDAPGLSHLYRYGIVPAFLFSGTFFPVDQLPDWASVVAAVVPLWHGVELARYAALGLPPAWHPVAHGGVLLGWAAAGAALATGRFRRRMTP